MSVYVDNLSGEPSRLHLCRWCKLWADSHEELVVFATERLEMMPSDIHIFDGILHFEIADWRRHVAIQKGALVWTLKEWSLKQNLR